MEAVLDVEKKYIDKPSKKSYNVREGVTAAKCLRDPNRLTKNSVHKGEKI